MLLPNLIEDENTNPINSMLRDAPQVHIDPLLIEIFAADIEDAFNRLWLFFEGAVPN